MGKTRQLHKPSSFSSKLLSLLNYKNPEDIAYILLKDHTQYMNYGMFSHDGPLHGNAPCAEANNYLELFSLADLPTSNASMKFLEIGCGFGYGAQLIYEVFRPESILAIDLAPNAIRYAKNNWNNPGVIYRNEVFSRNAALPGSVDVMYTVESGGDFPGREVFQCAHEMLRNNGIFLVASINPIEEINKKREFAVAAGFEIYREKDVTGQVVSYLKSDIKIDKFYTTLKNLPFHKYILCMLFMQRLKDFTRMPGSKTIDRLGNQESYYHFCFRKRQKTDAHGPRRKIARTHVTGQRSFGAEQRREGLQDQ